MNPLTFTYKQINDENVTLDLYHPPTSIASEQAPPAPLPVVVNFHGGGLTVGNTKSWFPSWLKGDEHTKVVTHFDCN